ncbi:MAG: PHP domain-containing protein [Patescibacteria group bacterium]
MENRKWKPTVFKIDLHTHSVASPDGGITEEQYARALSTNVLDVIAVTDHNHIDFALGLRQRLGDKIIVGEEIMTTVGEVIGLYLTERVKPGLSPLETVKQIKEQGGLVYVPHPFESFRHGLHPAVLEELIDYLDIIEVCNGRTFLQNHSTQSVIWAKMNRIIGAASSDAHGYRGLGTTYTRVKELPKPGDLIQTIAAGTPVTDRPGVRALLYPKYHRLRKKIRGTRK